MSVEDKAKRLVDHLQTVMEAAQRVDAKNAALREKLSRGELRVLRVLGRERHCVMGRLADSICLSLSSATGIIDGLIEKGLAKRERSPEDRRVVEVVLTDAGRALHAEAMAGPVEFARGLLKGLNGDEQDALAGLFRKIADRIESEKRAA
ncbi:MAG: MarR family transcriptional regulator [Elusimicrobia bacterium]|nr:MarR family transcriptional regulator [Elusimicrobiota bacterium]